MNNKFVSILLFAGILVLANFISNRFFLRYDLTQDKQYTLSKATKNIVKELSEPVTVTAYFSKDLPADIAKTKRDFQEMLIEYSNLSKGFVNYEFIAPETDEEKQKAQQTGIQPLMISVREKDQIKQQQAFMGAVIKMGDVQDIIPVIQPGASMEYALSTGIKKMAVKDKPSIAILQGHGEPNPFSELAQVYQSLSILYNIESLDLSTTPKIEDRIRALAIIAPKDSFPQEHLSALDDYLSRGGKMVLALNRVNADLQTQQGSPLNNGLETWLAAKGLNLESALVIDAQCGSVTVQQNQGPFMINTPVQFPYLPIITNFADHPTTKGIEQVMMAFASPVKYTGDATKTFTPIVLSSDKSGTQTTPLSFDISHQWTATDFPLSGQAVGAVLEGNIVGSTPSKLIVFGDGDFCISGQQRGQAQSEDNISLLVNSIDWLSDDTGLIELRTKGVASRPIDEQYLLDDAEGKRSFIKYLNFGLPLILILLYGFVRSQRQRSLRVKRMVEKF